MTNPIPTDDKQYSDDTSMVYRFRDAVEILCTGKGDSRSRLKDAYLSVVVLRTEDLPEQFRRDWDILSHEITRFSSRGVEYYENENQGRLELTLKRIKNKTASKMAKLIFDIYDYLTRENTND